MRALETALEVGSRNPIRGTLPFCWASAKRNETSVKTMSSQTGFVCMVLCFPGVEQCKVASSPNYLVRSGQHVRRNRQANLLGGFQIDHQLESGRLLDGQFGRLGSFEDLVD